MTIFFFKFDSNKMYIRVIFEFIFENIFPLLNFDKFKKNLAWQVYEQGKIAQAWKSKKSYKLNIYHDNEFFFVSPKNVWCFVVPFHKPSLKIM